MSEKIIIISSLLIVSSIFSSQAQTIHKDSLEHFAGVITTTTNTQPGNWPSDKNFQSYQPLKNSFDTFFFRKQIGRHLHELYQEHIHNNDDPFSRQFIIFLPQNSPLNNVINIPARNLKLVMLNNRGGEVNISYLTLWSVEGDSLKFQQLFSKPLRTFSGSHNLKTSFFLKDRRNLIFVVERGGGDEGWFQQYYSFFHLDESYNLNEFLEKEIITDRREEFKEIFFYEFLDNKFLITQKLKLLLVFEDTINSGGRYNMKYNPELEESDFEIIDLYDLLKQKAN
ncbi:MAG: hypothetical protein WD267_08605 [Balneolales bacterium]